MTYKQLITELKALKLHDLTETSIYSIEVNNVTGFVVLLGESESRVEGLEEEIEQLQSRVDELSSQLEEEYE